MQKFFIGILWLCLLALVMLLLGGFAGKVHPVGDSLAVFRLPFAILSGAVAFVLGLCGRGLAWATLGVICLITAPTALTYLPARPVLPGETVRIYQKNLYFRLANLTPIAQDIIKSNADVVLLQEVSRRNLPLLDILRSKYPYQARCRFTAIGQTAVLSRWPNRTDGPVCHERGGLTAMKVAAPQGEIWLVSLHLHWPYPYGQGKHVADLLPILESLDGPVIVGGDFNMVPWGASVRRIARATGTKPAGATMTTLATKRIPVFLPIDHVLLPSSWKATKETRPELGSDHRGVLVEFGWGDTP